MYTIGPLKEVNMVLFLRNKRFNVMLYWADYYLRWWRLPIEERACRKTDLGGGDYYFRNSGLPPSYCRGVWDWLFKCPVKIYFSGDRSFKEAFKISVIFVKVLTSNGGIGVKLNLNLMLIFQNNSFIYKNIYFQISHRS